jgi:hypothetical protein
MQQSQSSNAGDRSGAGSRCFLAFDDEVFAEEPSVLVVLMKSLRRQHHGNNRHLGFQLHIHQRVDDARRYELMSIDSPIHHETRRDDGGVAPGLRQQLRVQRNLERPRYLEAVNLRACEAVLVDASQECHAGLIDDVPMPAGLNEGDARDFYLTHCGSRT